ncbi:MAG: aspartate--tRNA(Asn) ligase [Candidatus Wallbacteria bacterium]|nr:aspartate--tRNA(Asn) ligase [Candidatus Wallbacteria bacterium]
MKWKNDAGRTLIGTMAGRIGCDVSILGRVDEIRDLGGVSFLMVTDRSGTCQIVADPYLDIPSIQSIVKVSGTVAASEKAPGGFEMAAKNLLIVSEPVREMPFNPARIPTPLKEGGPNLETVLNHRGLSLRAQSCQAVARVTSQALRAVENFFHERDFTEIKTSKLVGGGTEGGSGMFEVKYFERIAYLAQSPQLYKQALATTPLERVFEIGPVFRAEKFATGRHINEFTGIDTEISYPEGMHDLMDLEEDLLNAVIEHLAGKCGREIAALCTTLPRINGEIPRLELDRVKEILTGVKPSRLKPAEDLSPDEERLICEWSAREYGCDAVFVHSFPTGRRPFYTMPQENRKKSQSFDLILRGLEISSGCIRIHKADQLIQNIEKQGLKPESLKAYLEIFQFGCPPHGGFGLGLERLVQKLLDLPNIRHATLFPRDRNRLEP